MSCITIGRHAYFEQDCEVPLPHSLPLWTKSKMDRLTEMALSPDPMIRAVAAAHPKSRPGLLEALMMDEDVRVRRAAIKNPSATPAMIRTGLKDKDMGIVAYSRVLAG